MEPLRPGRDKRRHYAPCGEGRTDAPRAATLGAVMRDGAGNVHGVRSTEIDGSWPFVGRDAELAHVSDVLLSDRDSVVLAGETGVGKSRMAREAAALAATEYDVVTIAGTHAASEIPFGAIARFVPAAGDQSSPVSRAARIRECVVALANSADGRPRLLLVDDVHLLDAASATVIHHALMLDSCRLLATLRTNEPTLDVTAALWNDGLARRIDVERLGGDAVEAVLQAALGAPVDRGTVMDFARRAQGNMLLLRELVRGAREQGLLVCEDQLWRLRAPPAMSHRLIEIIEARLLALPPADREALEYIALGEPLGLEPLEKRLGWECLERLERRGLLATRRDGQRTHAGLSHPIYGEWLLAQLPPIRLRRLARELASTWEHHQARRREDVLRLAKWRLDGGGGSTSLMLQAALAARWSYDFPLAERFVNEALRQEPIFEGRLLLGQLHYLQGRNEAAEEVLAPLATSADGDEQRARVAITRLDNATFRGDAAAGLQIAEQSEEAIGDGNWRAAVAARRAGLLFAVEGPQAAAAVAAPLLENLSGPTVRYASLVACLSFGRLGRLGDALAAADVGAGAEANEDKATETYPWLSTFFRCDALLYAGDFRQAETLALEQYENAVEERSVEAQAYFGFQLAKAVSERGDVARALKTAREAAACFRQLGRPILLEPCLVDVVISLALSARSAEAEEVLASLKALNLSPSYYPVDVLRAEAWVDIAQGRFADARSVLKAAAELGERTTDRIGAFEALHLLARVGRPADALPSMERLAPHIDGRLAAARLAHVRALRSKDPDALERVCGAFEEMGADLLAAETAADAVGAAAGRSTTQRLAILRRRAAALRESVRDAHTPALAAGCARAELTPAELDAALLASQGLSNRAIAGRLFLSVRTVEGQLQRCYEKLHISRRNDIAGALEEIGAGPA